MKRMGRWFMWLAVLAVIVLSHSAQAALGAQAQVLLIGPVQNGMDGCITSNTNVRKTYQGMFRNGPRLQWARLIPDSKLDEVTGGKDYEFAELQASDFRLARDLGRRSGGDLVVLVERHIEKAKAASSVCQVTIYLLDVNDPKEAYWESADYGKGITRKAAMAATRDLLRRVFQVKGRQLIARVLAAKDLKLLALGPFDGGLPYDTSAEILRDTLVGFLQKSYGDKYRIIGKDEAIALASKATGQNFGNLMGYYDYSLLIQDNFRRVRALGKQAGVNFVLLIARDGDQGGNVYADLVDVDDPKAAYSETQDRRFRSIRQKAKEMVRSLFLRAEANSALTLRNRPQPTPPVVQVAQVRPGNSERLKKMANEARKERLALESKLKEAETLKKEREMARAEMEKMRRERESLAEKQKALEAKLRAEERRIIEERSKLEKQAKAEEERKRKEREAKEQASRFELAFWDTIRNSQNPADYQAYLAKYPDGQFASLAKIRMRQGAQQATRTPAAKPPSVERPNLYGRTGNYHALVIGINNYQHIKPLKTAASDAKATAEILEREYGFQVKLLVNAKRYDVLAALSHYRSTLTERDNLLIYYAGHGILDKEADTGYWLPADADKDITANWISTHDVTTALRAMNARHVLVIADSCYSGTLTRSAPATIRSAREKMEWLKRVATKRSRTVITSGGLEPVLDAGGGGHSVFAKEFLKALRTNDWVLDGNELFGLIKRPVVLNSQQTPEYSDIRNTGHDGGEFLFVRKR